MGERRPNRLIHETSPYLLQHAYNPVDWYPWGEEALERARREDKPLLVSIGYAACHWCHVMERESFEDPATAAIMNEHFVCVKVDREERPDLDAIYMDAVQAMTGGGGWPLTAFCTPDGRPFYAGTYFPPEDRHGLPAFRKILLAVAEAWRERRDEVLAQGERVLRVVGQGARLAAREEPGEEILREAFELLRGAFDRRFGGFGGAPKFPQPMTLGFLLRCHLRGMPDALEMLTQTLDRMAEGGIFDQVGGGFHRYAVDAAWHVPHFEKMLYDQAQLARLYARAWQVTGEARYRRVAQRTLDHVLRELRSPEGGFWSSLDADSEGEEGRFYVWPYEELVRVAGGGDLGRAVAACLGARPEGNWEGTNVLWRPVPVAAVAAELGRDPEELERAVEEAIGRLFRAREERVRPATDDKVLAGWNGLAISALAEAGRAFGEPRYVEAAVEAARFVLAELRGPDGRLARAWREGRRSGPGFADDHALLAEACLVLYETTFELRWFEEARRLADELLRLFHDEEGGGFFQTGADQERLVLRPKELMDNAVPSGNSAAADVLLRMALLTGEERYERAAAGALRAVAEGMRRAPTAFGHALQALDLWVGPAHEVAIVGDPAAPDTRALVEEVTVRRFLPNRVLAVAAPGDQAARRAVPLLAGRTTVDGRAAAYVCRRFVCELPVTEPEALAARLSA
ncbi:MAG TPA: thioredoxin domain-containing protein [Actinomycetota bacterium]|nr:thioredoxin domain-containing protein [Actinomycetota bacterium]